MSDEAQDLKEEVETLRNEVAQLRRRLRITVAMFSCLAVVTYFLPYFLLFPVVIGTIVVWYFYS